MLSDLKFALRGLLKAPGFTIVSVLILMLGIGAVTAVFSAVEAVLLRPLPFSRPQELYMVESGAANEAGLFALAEFRSYRDQNHSFQALAAITNFNTTYLDQGDAQLVQGLTMTANTFEMLGMRPVIGRLLMPDDDKPGAPKVVVIGEALWQHSYGGKPDALGRSVAINGQSYTIVGVSPASFELPDLAGFHSDVSLPLQSESDPTRYTQGTLHYMRVIGRIAPGITPAQARTDLAVVLNDLRRRYPNAYPGQGLTQISPLGGQIVANSRPMLLTLFGVVAGLLLLASTNLAGLHLVRAISRQREFAVRTALGASRARLVRLVVAECLLLAVAGGLAGLVLADWGVHSLLTFIPNDLPRVQGLEFNGTIFAFAALISLGFGLAPGLAPIWLVSHSDLRGAMASGGRGTTGGQNRVRRLLASIQVALALALLACTGLFLRSFWAAGAENLGFDPAHTLTFRLSLPEVGYRDTQALIQHYDRLQTQLAAIPGVETVGATSLLPLATGLATVDFQVVGQPVGRNAENPAANYRLVSPDYFPSMHIPLREGRLFTERDDATRPLTLVIGATLAAKMFPNGSALGQRLLVQDTALGFRTGMIVGVVGDVRQSKIEDPPVFDIYVPYRQMDPVAERWIRYRTYWVLRGTAPVATMESAVRRQVHAEDASIAIASVRTMDQVEWSALDNRRFSLLIIGFFAATALVLTIAGIYSVIAFGVAQRTREIGVRLALGAQTEQIFGLVLREGLGIVLWGAPIGVFASLILAQLIAAQLYGVSPRDPGALTGAVVLIGAIAFLACWIPARRAAQVSPIEALHSD